MTTKLDKLKAERAANAKRITERIAFLEARDGVLTQLEIEQAYLDKSIEEEREKACGLRVGDRLLIDKGFAKGQVAITAITAEHDNRVWRVWFKHVNGNSHFIRIPDAQRMRALYLKNHPESLITE